ncbi:hypothetical protein PM082_021029 [Marasmius tenuissimus]|nr:hypothetical protein PM082_021029 [Marasmius tenuissimus]
MPRSKLYHTKAERQEANRVKNKRFYNKHRKDILYLKQVKRDEENREAYRDIVQARKKRKEERGKQQAKRPTSVEITSTKEPVVAMSERLDLCLSELESKLDGMKEEHRQAVTPNAGYFCRDLCQRAVLWKQATRRPLMQQTTFMNPIAMAKNTFEIKLQEYQLLEDEYLYAIRDKTGRSWDDRRAEFTLYREVVSELVAVLDSLLCQMKTAGVGVKPEDLEPIYRTAYHFYFSNRK